MFRLNFLLVAFALAAVQVGCAQCDTCDDFPTPCFGGNCGSAGYAPVVPIAGPPGSPMMMPPGAPATGPLPPASGPSVFAPTAATQPAPISAPTAAPVINPPTASGPDLSPPSPPSLGDAGKPIF